MKGVQAVESCLHLPGPERELHAALADSDTGLGAEEGIPEGKPFATSRLMCPEFLEFTHQRVRQENIALAPTLGDFWADSEASSRGSIIYIDISHVQPYNLRQSQAGS
jgi:hypothetical protein